MRIAVIARIARRFDHLVDDGSGRGAVRISHPEIDHVLLRRPRRAFISLMTANT